jgi:Glycosyltransferase family 25 (LPS biosynthesis protein)
MTEPAIDGCIVINLPHRTDRWELFQQQIPLLNTLRLKPERMDAIYGRKLSGFGEKPWFTKRLSEKRANAWAGKAGATLSHRNAIAIAQARGWKNVLILEDDVQFEASVREQWTQLLETLGKLPDNWIALYLFGSKPSQPIRVTQAHHATSCYEIVGAIGAVAYVVNGRAFDLLLAELPLPTMIWPWTARHKTIDRWYSKRFCLLGRVLAMSPFGITHLGTPSDATTAGEAYDVSSFDLMESAEVKWFTVLRMVRCFQNRVALELSLLRMWAKRFRGL